MIESDSNSSSALDLPNEAFLTQNPALGATVIWRAACGYQAANKTRDPMPLQLSFLVVPVVFHRTLFGVLSRTQKDSGLRKFAEKFTSTQDAKQDILLSLHERCFRWKDLSWSALRLSFSTRLLSLTSDGTLIPLTETFPSAIPAKTVALLKNAEKLGNWFGSVSMHEISTLLKIRF